MIICIFVTYISIHKTIIEDTSTPNEHQRKINYHIDKTVLSYMMGILGINKHYFSTILLTYLGLLILYSSQLIRTPFH
jgi:hypothetical protein